MQLGNKNAIFETQINENFGHTAVFITFSALSLLSSLAVLVFGALLIGFHTKLNIKGIF